MTEGTTSTYTLKLEKLTKNKVRYQHVDASGNPVDDSHVGIVYISKAAFNGSGLPDKLEMTLKAVK